MTSDTFIPLQDLTPDTFRAYGWMLGKPMPDGNGVPLFTNAATDFWQEHVFNTGGGGDAELLWVNYRSRDADIASLEKHLLTQQAIVPLTGAVVQVVAQSAQDGSRTWPRWRPFACRRGRASACAPAAGTRRAWPAMKWPV